MSRHDPGPAEERELSTTRRFLSILCVLGIGSALLGRAAAAEEAAPRIRFDEVLHDFGKIPSDKKVRLAWTFHNDGNAPLQILEARTTCACTASVAQRQPVPPGGTGTLEVTFDPESQHGQVRKSIAVHSNDPAAKVVMLRIKADVVPTNLTVVAEGHPPISGQSLLMGSCGSCHAQPAAGKSGEELYGAVCAMCHGPRADGGRAPSLRAQSFLSGKNDDAIAGAIAFGTSNPKMPGFSEELGGPLTRAQVDSLVALLRRWGPVANDSDSVRGKPSPAPPAR